MISIHENNLLEKITIYKNEIDIHLATVKIKLISFINNPTRIEKRKPVVISLTPNQKKYLECLEKNLDDIVKTNSSNLEIYRSEFDNLIKPSEKETKEFLQFKDELLKRMGYDKLRSSLYSKFYEKIGINSCVYCNSQLAVTVNSVGGTKTAKFQVDHFQSKSEYPCFSISFFNLYPVCSSCNNKKGVKPLIFNLYTNDFNDLNDSRFSFKIEKKSLVKYRVNGDESRLKIIFSDSLDSEFNKTFDIEGIYNTQKDLAAEIILKSMIYNASYKEALRNSFNKLYGNDPIKFKRIIVGNYTERFEIHKRPMSKFTQDIARQMKLI